MSVPPSGPQNFFARAVIARQGEDPIKDDLQIDRIEYTITSDIRRYHALDQHNADHGHTPTEIDWTVRMITSGKAVKALSAAQANHEYFDLIVENVGQSYKNKSNLTPSRLVDCSVTRFNVVMVADDFHVVSIRGAARGAVHDDGKTETVIYGDDIPSDETFTFTPFVPG